VLGLALSAQPHEWVDNEIARSLANPKRIIRRAGWRVVPD
jgi:hypothetical protein